MMSAGLRPSFARFRRYSVVIVSVAVVLGALLILFRISGANVSAAAQAMVRGAFGSRYAFFSATLVRASPLILTGLAVAWAFSAGVFNIGVEGQFLVGASAATATALALPSGGLLTLVAAFVAGGGVGGAVSGRRGLLPRALPVPRGALRRQPRD